MPKKFALKIKPKIKQKKAYKLLKSRFPAAENACQLRVVMREAEGSIGEVSD